MGFTSLDFDGSDDGECIMGESSVELGAEHKRQIEQIIAGMDCAKDFECYKSGFTNLCPIKDIGMETFVECLEKRPEGCEFSFSYGDK